MTILRNYSWPGNVRELRNVIEGAVALSENDEINVWDIPDYIVQSRQQGRETRSGESLHGRLHEMENNIIRQQLKIDDGKLGKAAEHLGLSKQLLWYKMNRRK